VICFPGRREGVRGSCGRNSCFAQKCAGGATLYIRVGIQRGAAPIDRRTCLCRAGPPRESPWQGLLRSRKPIRFNGSPAIKKEETPKRLGAATPREDALQGVMWPVVRERRYFRGPCVAGRRRFGVFARQRPSDHSYARNSEAAF
jgi:hypothetical protein